MEVAPQRFVDDLQASLARRPVRVLDGARMASVAAVLRVDGDRVRLLFIRRAVNPRDRWSGQIAFPGGKCEANETSLETAMREAKEEVGLDLASATWLGQLPDRVATSGNKMVVSTHVFLWAETAAPSFSLQTSEVSAAFWVDVDHLLTARPRELRIRLDAMMRRTSEASLLHRLLCLLGWTTIKFPCIYLPLPHQTCSDDEASHRGADEYVLWGLTYGMVLDLFKDVPGARHRPASSLLLVYKHSQRYPLLVLLHAMSAVLMCYAMAKL
ncbi:hypothetical protein SPRG_01655 [Saprolegnia parasitica CBS 223.65]|uniref:Nudix hydrolase domain-containing protein n=1 Tax=Saprolegnia parasitica (strain CBS 223.65) TaxID=695850 RepID=A0A067CX04_SAPPC|nr:hypothetical protein SPRG_01655 [Saprolegnia parasitica CBS 223.65]KDO33775.1 hypothetical protein SPRG_01655 [Saprolegnia parasitica CBS 223.65]|eukprot:XP_012195412.1 hypothetical protein SPRG_01655 [Saprolegnia parasitica CBS 223.65]